MRKLRTPPALAWVFTALIVGVPFSFAYSGDSASDVLQEANKHIPVGSRIRAIIPNADNTELSKVIYVDSEGTEKHFFVSIPGGDAAPHTRTRPVPITSDRPSPVVRSAIIPEMNELAHTVIDEWRRESSQRNPLDALYKVTSDLYSFTTGSGDTEFHIYFDPYCSHCHRFYNQLKADPRVKAHWIPVSIGLNNQNDIDYSLVATAWLIEQDMLGTDAGKMPASSALNGNDPLSGVSREQMLSISDKAWEIAFRQTYFFATLLESNEEATGTPIALFKKKDGTINTFVSTPTPALLDSAIGY